LMDAFYSAVESGNSKTESLRQAQIALITGNYSVSADPSRGIFEWQLDPNTTQPIATAHALNHPYYWAPFILIGNGL
jgi:CHAT domain-containing protein